jgi:hypothetical protein
MLSGAMPAGTVRVVHDLPASVVTIMDALFPTVPSSPVAKQVLILGQAMASRKVVPAGRASRLHEPPPSSVETTIAAGESSS